MTHTQRDWRIDWLRGLALVSIFVNHMPGNRLENWTTRNFGFSDAAEVFVLLAGVAAALAFFKRFDAGQATDVSLRTVRRAGLLYSAHLLSTLAAIVMFALAANVYENPGYLDLIGVAPLAVEPWPGLVGIVTGGYQLGYFNILPMYVLLLLALPGYLWLAKRSVWLMLAVSGGLYFAAQVLPLDMPNYPVGGGWFFSPFAWQLIFAIGLAFGIMRLRGQSVPYSATAYAAALGYVGFSAVWMIWSLGGHLSHGILPGWMDTLHKSYLPLPRLLHVLALAYILVHSRVWTYLAHVATVDPVLTRLGRNSLPVFVAGSLASMAGYIVLVQIGSNLAVEIALTTSGIAIMWIVALTSEMGVLAAWSKARSVSRRLLVGVTMRFNRSGSQSFEPTTIRTGRRR
jgi:hypothetical protein